MEAQKSSSNAKASRRQIRVLVMQACYAHIISGSSHYEVFDSLLDKAFLSMIEKGSETYNPDNAQFLKELFYGTINNMERYQGILKANLQNWNVERTALIDRVLILMGIHEMLTFEEIPVKVTINEYIEVSKIYSTGKSSVFVNGVLDAIFIYLKDSQQIFKSGRGLVTNSSH